MCKCSIYIYRKYRKKSDIFEIFENIMIFSNPGRSLKTLLCSTARYAQVVVKMCSAGIQWYLTLQYLYHATNGITGMLRHVTTTEYRLNNKILTFEYKWCWQLSTFLSHRLRDPMLYSQCSIINVPALLGSTTVINDTRTMLNFHISQ